jgi:Flp pilus assembly protein TadG
VRAEVKRLFSLRRNRAAFRKLLRRLLRGRDGAAAVEFAFIALPMIAVYFGATQIASGVMADNKVTQLTRALADLTAQAGSIPDTERDNIFAAAQTVMTPYTDVAPAMSITSIVIDANRNVTVCWNETKNSGKAFTAGAGYTGLPESLRVANSSVIMATASYTYKLDFKSPLSDMINIPITNAPVYMRPRLGQFRAGIEQVARVKDGVTKMCP